MPNVTVEDIANMSANLLTEARIDSLDEDSKFARLFNLYFDTIREAELSKNAWWFATLYPNDIEATDTEQDGAFRYLYEVPTDMIRPAWITRDGSPDGVPLTWTRWADGIRTDFEGPLKLPYIANIIDPNDWDALFTLALSASLAVTVAHNMTGKANMVQVAQGAYDRAISDAARVNAIQRIGRFPERSWATQRGDNRYWRA